jgi:hypothetical protein
MNSRSVFDILFLIGRPAAGKSEIIDYLKRVSPEERKRMFRIGEFLELDDFPMLWAWFEEDHILTEMGLSRLHTNEEGFFRYTYLWNLLIRRLELEYWKKVKENIAFGETRTAIIEFARGSEHGGFREAFSQFSTDLLLKSAVLYIDVPFEESLRKNRQRYNPDKPHSILEHALPDDKLQTLYGEVDWEELSSPDPRRLHLAAAEVPYAVFENSDDVTSGNNPELAHRLEDVLSSLWKNYWAT